MKRLNIRGDTIIEVLLSMTIVSSVLGGGFVAANKYLDGSRLAQERGEATKFAEAQMESLKVIAGDPTNRVHDTTSGKTFCVDSSRHRVDIAPGPLPALAADNLASYPAACRVGTDGRYSVAIERVSQNDFTVTARWNGSGLGGLDEVKFNYRVY